ncbi:MAG: hypothetical protein ACJ8J0_09235 [Longimicrobiaceae bacterium]
MEMATTPPRPRRPIYLFHAILRSINKLPPKARPGLIGVIVWVMLSLGALRVVGGTDAVMAITVMGLGAAIVVIATAPPRHARHYVAFLLVFCLSIAWLNRKPRYADKVVPAKDLAAVSEADSERVASRVVPDDSTLVSGNVRYRGTNMAVSGASVDVEGYGAGSAMTDDKGYFGINVPRRHIKIHGDSVTLAIRVSETVTHMFSAPFQGRPFLVSLDPPPASVAENAEATAGRAMLTAFPETLAPAPAAAAQEGLRARVVLDSVRTLHDGTAGSTWWRFDLNVNSVHAVTIPQRSYDRRRDKNLLYLGGEVTIVVPQSSRLSLHMRGLRDAWIGVRQANGYAHIDGAALQPEQPVHGQILVRSDNPNDGDFIFYYTVVRRGTPNVRANAASGST